MERDINKWKESQNPFPTDPGPAEPGIEEGDWLDYINPLKNILTRGLKGAASTAGSQVISRLRSKDAPKPKRRPPKPGPDLVYDKQGISTRPVTDTQTAATTGFKPGEGYKFERGTN